jgi:hypothetical protein
VLVGDGDAFGVAVNVWVGVGVGIFEIGNSIVLLLQAGLALTIIILVGAGTISYVLLCFKV